MHMILYTYKNLLYTVVYFQNFHARRLSDILQGFLRTVICSIEFKFGICLEYDVFISTTSNKLCLYICFNVKVRFIMN